MDRHVGASRAARQPGRVDGTQHAGDAEAVVAVHVRNEHPAQVLRSVMQHLHSIEPDPGIYMLHLQTLAIRPHTTPACDPDSADLQQSAGGARSNIYSRAKEELTKTAACAGAPSDIVGGDAGGGQLAAGAFAGVHQAGAVGRAQQDAAHVARVARCPGRCPL